MQAYQPQRQPQQPVSTPKRVRRRVPQKRQSQQSRRNRAVFVELSLQTAVNCALIGVAATAIANLLPHHLSQQERIAEIHVELAEAQNRVNVLREDFEGNFDAYETPNLMREHSDKVDLLEKRVIWVKPDQN